MPTCLFTDADLPPNTRLEHTLPRAMCGRFRSREVSSSRFNNDSSEIDALFHEPYRAMLNYLAPALAAEHEQAPLRVDMREAEGEYVVHDGGELALRRMRVDRRDERGRPVEIAHEDPEELRRRAAAMGWGEDEYRLEYDAASHHEIGYSSSALVVVEIEVCALKSILLTFDHLLAGVEGRFTRHDDLRGVRDEIRRAVIEGAMPQRVLQAHSLGLVYESVPRILELRRRYGPPERPFEHTLIASANAATRTLDLVWLVAGFDPHAFRLDWRGPGFTWLAGSGMLRGDEPWGPVDVPQGLFLGAPTARRSFPTGVREEDLPAIGAEIAAARHAAYRRTVDYVERTLPGVLRGGTISLTRFESATNDAEGRVEEGYRARLRRLFGDRLDDAERARGFEALITQALVALPEATRGQTIARADAIADHVGWAAWHDTHCRVLDALAVGGYGLPGRLFTEQMHMRVDTMGGRPMGEPPRGGAPR